MRHLLHALIPVSLGLMPFCEASANNIPITTKFDSQKNRTEKWAISSKK